MARRRTEGTEQTPRVATGADLPGRLPLPGGETLREVQNRVITALERIRTQHQGEAVAVYAHGDVLRTSMAYYLGTPLDLFQRIQISTASVSLVTFHRFGPSILAMNDSGGLPVIKWRMNQRLRKHRRTRQIPKLKTGKLEGEN